MYFFLDGKRFVNLICHRRIISTNFKGLSLYKIARQFIQLAVANQSYLHYLSIFFTLLQKILLSLIHYHLLVLPVFPLVYHSIYCVYCCCCWLGNQCDLRRELPTRFWLIILFTTCFATIAATTLFKRLQDTPWTQSIYCFTSFFLWNFGSAQAQHSPWSAISVMGTDLVLFL